jgi:hypothetical protein
MDKATVVERARKVKARTKYEAPRGRGKAPVRVPGRAVRVPNDLLERAARLVPRLEAGPFGSGPKWTDAAVVRLVIARGLAALEAELEEVPT